MTVKELLESHKSMDLLINSKIEQLQEFRSLATKMSANLTNGSKPGGTVSDRVGRTAAKIVDLENDINDHINRLLGIKTVIENILSSINNTVYAVLLERRYVMYEPWEVIAEKMNYTPRHITRLHNRAMEYLERTYPEDAIEELINKYSPEEGKEIVNE